MNNHLHIISFDVPYPANYGGVIDVYYKLRALHKAGIHIHLHCFEYQRRRATELNDLCEEVIYYRRASGLKPNLSLTPYIVESRRSEKLLGNLLKDDYPILFEGIHTTYLISDSQLKDRIRIYRESNIEHHYYYHLFRAEKNLLTRTFFLAESVKLKFFQRTLKYATAMLTVSEEDTRYLKQRFPANQVVYLPSFHREDKVCSLRGKGTYALYQGNLSVPENTRAAEFLMEKVWHSSLPELVIAGLNPPDQLVRMAGERKNIRLVINPTDNEMYELILNAQVNIMVTFQATGLKLKLLNALFNGRFCLVNPEMVEGTSLAELCTVVSEPEEFRSKIRELFSCIFTEEAIRMREAILMSRYSNQKNCNLLLDILTLR